MLKNIAVLINFQKANRRLFNSKSGGTFQLINIFGVCKMLSNDLKIEVRLFMSKKSAWQLTSRIGDGREFDAVSAQPPMIY